MAGLRERSDHNGEKKPSKTQHLAARLSFRCGLLIPDARPSFRFGFLYRDGRPGFRNGLPDREARRGFRYGFWTKWALRGDRSAYAPGDDTVSEVTAYKDLR